MALPPEYAPHTRNMTLEVKAAPPSLPEGGKPRHSKKPSNRYSSSHFSLEEQQHVFLGKEESESGSPEFLSHRVERQHLAYETPVFNSQIESGRLRPSHPGDTEDNSLFSEEAPGGAI